MENIKTTIQKLYEEYKREYLNELYDSPLNYKKENNSYIVFNENGDELAFFTFRFGYNIEDSPVNYKKYKLSKYWDVNWYWNFSLKDEEKNNSNFIKVTSTAFKIVDDFIRNNNTPSLLGFGGLTKGHDNIYSSEGFIDRWRKLFGEKYYVEWKNNKLWIINKNFYKIDENRLVKSSIFQQKPISEVYILEKSPNKKEMKGISRHNLIKEQIRRIILKEIYIK